MKLTATQSIVLASPPWRVPKAQSCRCARICAEAAVAKVYDALVAKGSPLRSGKVEKENLVISESERRRACWTFVRPVERALGAQAIDAAPVQIGSRSATWPIRLTPAEAEGASCRHRLKDSLNTAACSVEILLKRLTAISKG